MSYKKYSLKEQLEIIQAFMDGKSIRFCFTYATRTTTNSFDWKSDSGYQNKGDKLFTSKEMVINESNSCCGHNFDFENNDYEIIEEPKRAWVGKLEPESKMLVVGSRITLYSPKEYIELTDEVKEKLGIE